MEEFMNLTFRIAKQEDFPQCAALIAAAFNPISETYGFQPTEDLTPLIASLENLPDPEDQVYSVWQEDAQVGCFSLERRDEGVYEITKFSVRPECQRQGVGQCILNYIFELIGAKNGVAAVCTIFDDNLPVKSWLLKNGFQEIVIGSAAGIPCAVCLLQKEFESSCSEGCGCQC